MQEEIVARVQSIINYSQKIMNSRQSPIAMRRAGQELGQRDPRRAHPHQQSAMSELEQIQQSLEKSCKKGGQGGGMPLPMGSSGRGGGYDWGNQGKPSLEEVEIPGADAHQSPEEFRQDLLEGMKDPVPQDYQPQVRRYYEELIR